MFGPHHKGLEIQRGVVLEICRADRLRWMGLPSSMESSSSPVLRPSAFALKVEI